MTSNYPENSPRRPTCSQSLLLLLLLLLPLLCRDQSLVCCCSHRTHTDPSIGLPPAKWRHFCWTAPDRIVIKSPIDRSIDRWMATGNKIINVRAAAHVHFSLCLKYVSTKQQNFSPTWKTTHWHPKRPHTPTCMHAHQWVLASKDVSYHQFGGSIAFGCCSGTISLASAPFKNKQGFAPPPTFCYFKQFVACTCALLGLWYLFNPRCCLIARTSLISSLGFNIVFTCRII